jgi:hypothetical protein
MCFHRSMQDEYVVDVVAFASTGCCCGSVDEFTIDATTDELTTRRGS